MSGFLRRRPVAATLLALVTVALAWLIAARVIEALATVEQARDLRVAPVEVAPVETGTVRSLRTFSGTLRARAEFTVSPKVAGRIERLLVDISDPVARGQVVAELDDDEFALEVEQSAAELAVARANLVEAESALEISNRAYERSQSLRLGGVASESELDIVETQRLAAQARLAVARAQVTRAEAALRTSEIRVGYTRVRADWSDGMEQRAVATRFVDAGQMVSANAQLMHIVELDPLTGVIFVTEKDYGKLSVGQPVTILTDAFPGEVFAGVIERISPVFLETSRQARVEVKLPNPEKRLKPGMFIRATVLLDVADDATVVPGEAIASRQGQTGVFLVNAAGTAVSWRPVVVGIREERRVQVIGEGLAGLVVTLGQHLIGDGSRITIPEGIPQGTAR